jgi:hypothetical protein
MVESPELIVNADVGQAIAGSECFLLHCNMIPIIEPIRQMSSVLVHCSNQAFYDPDQQLTIAAKSLVQGVFCDAAAGWQISSGLPCHPGRQRP